MKISVVKVVAGLSLLYLGFTLVVIVVAGIRTLATGFSPAAFGQLLMTWEPHWWWLSLLGGAAHLVAFVLSLRRDRLLVANTLCLWAFIAYALVPNYMVVTAFIHAGAVLSILTYRRPRAAQMEVSQ
ncbi:hypothetical protein [Lacticaseibacillus absianus]|uniref:hypothetical protein n=1 Tax=Lacticaseibacillus absianus TaxID=2729623 RepID=UPI0015CA9E73|nr:hypothetical protein [Lacticaseibacillus absianus]